jgi:hypothetical protein
VEKVFNAEEKLPRLTIQQKTTEGWKEITEEDFRKKFYTVAMFAHALSLLRMQGHLLAGAWEFRTGAE